MNGRIVLRTPQMASLREPLAIRSFFGGNRAAIRGFGSTVIVIGANYEKGVDKGKPWERRGRFTDTWMFDGWPLQCVASQFSVKPK